MVSAVIRPFWDTSYKQKGSSGRKLVYLISKNHLVRCFYWPTVKYLEINSSAEPTKWMIAALSYTAAAWPVPKSPLFPSSPKKIPRIIYLNKSDFSEYLFLSYLRRMLWSDENIKLPFCKYSLGQCSLLEVNAPKKFNFSAQSDDTKSKPASFVHASGCS